MIHGKIRKGVQYLFELGEASCFAKFKYRFACKSSTGIFFLMMFLSCCLCRTAAQEVSLNSKDNLNREAVSVRLYDHNEGNFLLELPLTFHVTPNGILFMIVGNDNGVTGNHAVWMFDKTVSLNDFLKRNRQIGTAKSLKKQISRLESFYDGSENIKKFTLFDNGYEHVQASPKPVFFKVGDTSKPVVLKLKFYTSFEKNDGSQDLTAEAGTVKITINL